MVEMAILKQYIHQIIVNMLEKIVDDSLWGFTRWIKINLTFILTHNTCGYNMQDDVMKDLELNCPNIQENSSSVHLSSPPPLWLQFPAAPVVHLCLLFLIVRVIH